MLAVRMPQQTTASAEVLTLRGLVTYYVGPFVVATGPKSRTQGRFPEAGPETWPIQRKL
jgi:hypothetical protein